MADPVDLEQDAMSFAQRAVRCDQEGLVDTAIFYYTEAAQALVSASLAGSRIPNLIDKGNEYLRRVEELKRIRHNVSAFAAPSKSQQQLDMERARFLVEQAFEEDAGGNEEEAFELYTQAAEMCLKLCKETSDKEIQSKVTKLAQQALDRAEILKKVESLDLGPDPPSTSPQTGVSSVPHRPNPRSPLRNRRTINYRPLGDSLLDDGDARKGAAPSGAPRRLPPGGGGGNYTKEEINVLRDRHGLLTLSPKQREKLGRWARPEEFCTNPQMIYAVSSFSIKQTIVSDCSFVASLAISAQYERRFKKKLITSIIYPQNRSGEPQYNPCGKYMVKLNLNGVHRKVIIDDTLPMSHSGELLCSYSNNRNELWVSLMEKAYMKVMGGYDFPGSNSNIDLHALTGWIPERVAIRPGTEDFHADKEFSRIMDYFHKGKCLVTIATGDIPEKDADRAGLVPTHAYAMLDIRIVKGKKLIQLKNPWSHLRWRGNFSELDTVHWTEDMKKQLNFNPKQASMVDNGIFWIDYDSILKFYDVIYMNWNPDLFPHTTCMHHTWTSKDGPKKDAYNIGDNPQYRLEVKGSGPSGVWILLTRHITDKDDFANNREFITVLVYKTQGKRVFYPYDPPPYKDGVRINSPHYLCKVVEDKGPQLYSLVISQYEKSNTIHYTLRVYATCDFKMSKIAEPYVAKYEKQLNGQWKGKTAGGCTNYQDTHPNNPIYQVKIDNTSTDNQILVELRGPKQFSIGFSVVCVSENVTNTPGAFKKKTSGDFRRGFSMLELENVPGGVYNISPCTYSQGKEGPFFLNISSSTAIHVTQLQ